MFEVIVGDAREQLKLLPDRAFHCCVTSPPYFGLRDYGCEGQLGLELTPDAFVAEMVAVFREVRRVLRDDGTLWLNIGDSYATGTKGGAKSKAGDKNFTSKGTIDQTVRHYTYHGIKHKDLVGIPWMVAFALRADGWYLRQDIIWSKPNPMPESVTDRCTKAHEYIFLMTKAERYYYDADAIAEDAIGPAGGNTKPNKSFEHDPVKHRTKAGLAASQEKARQAGGFVMRNKRSVWTVATAPFSEAHFATFPPALITPCILAGCPVGGRVLDCFGGAGTTGLVAATLGRTATLIELNPEYAVMARARIEAAFMGREEGSRHMVKQLGKTAPPGPLFGAAE
jgi:DNA modification methylase